MQQLTLHIVLFNFNIESWENSDLHFHNSYFKQSCTALDESIEHWCQEVQLCQSPVLIPVWRGVKTAGAGTGVASLLGAGSLIFCSTAADTFGSTW